MMDNVGCAMYDDDDADAGAADEDDNDDDDDYDMSAVRAHLFRQTGVPKRITNP